jgi:hypothetical protein
MFFNKKGIHDKNSKIPKYFSQNDKNSPQKNRLNLDRINEMQI